MIPAGTTQQLNGNDVLRMLSATSKNYFAPGPAYRHSNSGYVLLGLVVERASGESLPAFLQQRIFRPLHMDHTLMYVRGGPEVSHRGDTLWHSGESIGFRNVIVRWPRQHLTVILLSNRNDPEPYRTVPSIAEPFLHPALRDRPHYRVP